MVVSEDLIQRVQTSHPPHWQDVECSIIGVDLGCRCAVVLARLRSKTDSRAGVVFGTPVGWLTVPARD
jgi:hypothetical protein